MGRKVRDWKPIVVDDLPVAPHRYHYKGTIGPNGEELANVELAKDYTEARRTFPYQEGEVVYMDDGGKAVRVLIYAVCIGRNMYGDRTHEYKVQRETKGGTFSKLWERTYPGFIQRGYARAGIATEFPYLEGAA